VSLENVNRRSSSQDDNSEPGSVYNSDRIADGAIGPTELQDESVGDQTIDSNFALLLNSAVSDNRALLEETTGDLDDIDDGFQFGRVGNESIDGDARIILSEVVGDLDDVDDGTDFGRVDTTALSPGGLVVANGVELDDGRTFDDITVEDFEQADATVIDGGEILTGSITATQIDAATITADEIDTLSLDTNQIEINGIDSTLVFEASVGASGDFFEVYPTGTVDTAVWGGINEGGEVAVDSNRTSNMDEIRPYDGDNSGSVGVSSEAYSEMHAHNFITASPDPIESVDCSGLCDVDWYDRPPEPVRQRARDIGDTDGEIPDGRDHTPVELGTMSNWLLETCKAQQERIEDLEERLDALERQNT